ncbi:MAG: hypothetical protein ACYTG1_01020 [Planctomycetota bacterium]|jgi:hypothetical protein
MRTLLLVVFCTALVSGSMPPGKGTTITERIAGDRTAVVRLAAEEVMATSAWERAAPNPPVPAAKALRLAVTGLRKVEPAPTDWELEGLWLSPFPRAAQRGDLDDPTPHWYWRARFLHTPPPGKGADEFGAAIPARVSIVVLMDGTVVLPEVRER